MPANQFICPNGERILITECLHRCPYEQRCMFLPTLRAVANSLDRNVSGATVTELIAGIRETYLKKTIPYAVNPQEVVYALHGSAVHTLHEGYNNGNIMAEERLYDAITSGKFDLYGEILDRETGVLGDLKVTSSYKIIKALGRYQVRVPTGTIYKTGLKKGQEKFKKEWRDGGVRNLLDWAIQLNYYRLLLEDQGFTVSKMIIQALCRDQSLRIAQERGIDQAIYLIPIQPIQRAWLLRYMNTKAKALEESIVNRKMPPHCKARERWHDRKCLGYCQVAEYCSYGKSLRNANQTELPEVS
ncbi:MAG: hypothetical protein E6713_07385 [Sporomusaceae bacterium]|nr:hypothetical protein [Sporomusaceae bacterium]